MTDSPVTSRPEWARFATILAVILIAAGTVARLAPLFNQDDRVFWQFPSEDGYLMLQIARNLALGNGMSTAEGTILTNGTQPLATFVYAAGFWAVGGNKFWGTFLAQVILIIMSLLTAGAICLLIRDMLSGRNYAGPIALLCGAWWYARYVGHTMNCLETVFYVFFCVVSVWIYYRYLCISSRLTPFVWFGVLLGLTFLARVDACFFILAICIVHLGSALFQRGPHLQQRLAQTMLMGTVSIVTASPWLIYSYVRFGNLIPVSGAAQWGKAFGGNLSMVPPALLEFITTFALIPNRLNTHLLTIAAALLAIVALVVFGVLLWQRAGAGQRYLLAITAIYSVCMVFFYGFVFGAPHFVERYLFPLTPYILTITVLSVIMVMAWLPERTSKFVGYSLGVLTVFIAAVIGIRAYVQGPDHLHRQVVEYVQEEVNSQVWVGAVQTGTLGFFHDRTINLDGKVNPYALDARMRNVIKQYVVDTPIMYLVDWVGMVTWYEDPSDPVIREHFEVVVRDAERNLGVLKRTTTPPVDHPLETHQRLDARAADAVTRVDGSD